jgi:hypothetical protein
MVEGDLSDGQQNLASVDAVMADASHLSEFLQSLNEVSTDLVTLQYRCDRQEFFMDGCFAVLEWEATPLIGGEPVRFSYD